MVSSPLYSSHTMVACTAMGTTAACFKDHRVGCDEVFIKAVVAGKRHEGLDHGMDIRAGLAGSDGGGMGRLEECGLPKTAVHEKPSNDRRHHLPPVVRTATAIMVARLPPQHKQPRSTPTPGRY